jgi:hypothetical protein
MKINKSNYFNLLEDDIIYKTYQEQIDKFIEEEKEIENKKKDEQKLREKNKMGEVLTQSEIDELLAPIRHEEYLSCPKEIEIIDSEYETLKQHSEWLNKYEGQMDDFAFAFESYREKLKKEEEKNYKLKEIIMALMGNTVNDIEDKINVVLNILL